MNRVEWIPTVFHFSFHRWIHSKAFVHSVELFAKKTSLHNDFIMHLYVYYVSVLLFALKRSGFIFLFRFYKLLKNAYMSSDISWTAVYRLQFDLCTKYMKKVSLNWPSIIICQRRTFAKNFPLPLLWSYERGSGTNHLPLVLRIDLKIQSNAFLIDRLHFSTTFIDKDV